MPRVLVPLAEGCEELEAVTVIDLLRRAGVEVAVAGLTEGPVRASRGVVLVPDTTLDALGDEPFDMIVLPGGGPGTKRLEQDERVLGRLRAHHASGRPVAAICAAPGVLAAAGLLQGRRATAYPGILEALRLPDTTLVGEPVVEDRGVITSRGPGTALDFALHLIQVLCGPERREGVETPLQRAGR